MGEVRPSRGRGSRREPAPWIGDSLHLAASLGTPELVAELAGGVADVDALEDGKTPLWNAVMSDRPDNARALVAAGANPWRPLFGGWSPGRLSLAGPIPDLFVRPEGERGLSEAERAAETESKRLIGALGGIYYEGTGLACVAGIDAEEAIRRLEATPVADGEMERLFEDSLWYAQDEALRIIGVTTVPGGCVVTQPWGYAPNMTGVEKRLSVGTLCYGLYANPKSGNQGDIVRDGVVEAGDLHPGGGDPDVDDTPEEVFASYLYRNRAAAYSCAFAGLRLTDARAIEGPPDRWVRLPERDHWED